LPRGCEGVDEAEVRVGWLGGEVVGERVYAGGDGARPVVLMRVVCIDGDSQRLVHADLLRAEEGVVLGGVDVVEGLV
jgi:hypothetical protein